MMAELTTKIKLKEDNPELWGNSIPVIHGDNGFTTEEEVRAAIDELNESRMVTMEAENTITDMLQEKEDFVESVTTTTKSLIDDSFRPRNRAERRALEKATRRQKAKKKKMYMDSIKETAEKLAYINMIEKVRELNNKIKEEGVIENEAAN